MSPSAELAWESITAPAEFAELAEIATEVWHEHYTPIIGREQVVYMLGRFQTPAAIAAQVQAGMHYWFIVADSERAGYLAAEPRDESLFISKFYLRRSHRGRGLGRASMDFLANFARGQGLGSLTLTVNRHNNSVAIYERLGFIHDGAICQDIGSGYVMDDFCLSKRT